MSPDISVARNGDGSFSVEIRQDAVVTHHVVTVPAALRAKLGTCEGDDTRLVEASFAWLLAREPAEAILRRFSLEVIGDYFPAYTSEIAGRLT